MAKKRLHVAVLDVETDPFKHGREKIEAFAVEFFDGTTKQVFWGSDCVERMVRFLRALDRPYLIYAHNGGKFDIVFFAHHIDNPVRVINSRVVSCKLAGHELRDSFAIIPVAQREFEKTKIDYAIFERDKREAHKDEILAYLHDDCAGLYKLVRAFQDRFGDYLTVGSTAINQLKQFYYVGRGTKEHDVVFRPFYFGGRVECFEAGALRGDWHVYDVNSMYPYAMAHFDHPDGRKYIVVDNTTIDRRGRLSNGAEMYFAEITCVSRGAFPVRVKDGIVFPNSPVPATFHVCSHEIVAALECGLISRIKVHRAYVPRCLVRFDKFVSKFSADKIAAKAAGDKVAELFAKFMLNSCYGKYGQNPDNYKDYVLARDASERPAAPYRLDTYTDNYELWCKPSEGGGYYDVAVAASITSASRATLMRGIFSHKRVAYCDTDSIICDGPALDLPIDNAQLGAWKLEARGDMLAIAGKKLYALFDRREVVKQASKGVHLPAGAILAIARGREMTWHSEAPSMGLGKPIKYVTRKVRRTV